MNSAGGWDLDEPDRYGRSFADVYDRWYGDIDPIPAVVDRLVSVAHGPRLVEFGAGTGRLAVPLATAGFHVVAVDVSPAMLGRIPLGAASARVSPVLADMARLPIADRSIDVALIAYNTLFSLPNASAQADTIAEAARSIDIDGIVVIDAIVPVKPPATASYRMAQSRQEPDEAVLIATRQYRGDRKVTGTHLHFTRSGFRSRPWVLTTQSPSEIDDMAAAAGLSLIERSSDWAGRAFSGGGRHISFYGF